MNITEVVTYTIPQSRRREELSICNVVFAALVILIHLLAEPVSLLDKNSALYFLAVGLWRLSSFVVQGFFFLSGAKLFLGGPPVKPPSDLGKSTENSSVFHKCRRTLAPWCRFWLGRIRRVVVPYAVAFALFALYFTLTGALSPTPAGLLRDFVTGKLCGHFYYVILICQFYLLMPLWQRLVRRSHPVFLLPAAMLVTVMCKIYMPSLIELLTGQPFTENGLLFTSYLFYFLAGAAVGPVYDRFRVFLAEKQTSLVVGWAILGLSNWLLYWQMSRGTFYLPWLELYHMLYCLYAIPAALSLAARFRHAKLFCSNFFTACDRWSYQVYLLHPLAIFLSGTLLTAAGLTSTSLRFVLSTVVTYGVMAAFCVVMTKFSRKKKK